ncbi:hypothetical protein Tco_0624690 [Tanacetum coccineum]|uniref:Uncharacterized protein n=1 Tax=Tanacetum coccineum TaxID=301880 RepID=A0ABQ4WEQ2_9ASTR
MTPRIRLRIDSTKSLGNYHQWMEATVSHGDQTVKERADCETLQKRLSKTEEINGGKWEMHQGWVYAVGNAGKEGRDQES